MAISPTKLQTYKTCPRQYEAKYLTKEVVFVDTPHTLFGTAVHKNIENRLNNVAALSPLLIGLEPILAKHSNKLMGAETPLAINRQFLPVDTANKFTMYKNAWVHCIVDAIFVDNKGKRLVALDWKTGKGKESPIQADIIKMCLASKFPYFRQIETVFVHLFHGDVFHDIHRPGVDNLINIKLELNRLEHAEKKGEFPPTPNGLCNKWCDVLSCPYNGRNK